jgi:deferrochelatase/peroxidase EfeB
MDSPEYPQQFDDDKIIINGRSDIDFWCLRFSISPFTLFHLLRTVGNSARQIGEFLHKDQGVRLDRAEEPLKNISIL